MPRKRLISPEFFAHGELYDAERESGLPLRLAYAGLWTACDRRGLFTWKPRELKLIVLPYDPVDFEQVLFALEYYGFVKRYVVEGRAFGFVPSFERWQTFHKNEKPSDIPKTVFEHPEPSNGWRVSSNGRPEPSGDSERDDASRAITVTGTVVSTGAGTGTKNNPPRKKREPATNGSAPSDVLPAKRPDTWLTPIRDAWEAIAGAGSFGKQFGQAAHWLEPIWKAGTDPPTIAAHLTCYLEQTNAEYWSIATFAKSFEKWKPEPLVDEFGILTPYGERITRP